MPSAFSFCLQSKFFRLYVYNNVQQWQMRRMQSRSSKLLMLGQETLVIMSDALNVEVSPLKILKLISPYSLERLILSSHESRLNKRYICCNKEIFKLILPIAILLFQTVVSCYAIASLSLIQYIYPHDPAGCIS